MINVFTYGSLMFSPVWQRVVIGRYNSVGATVHGFARFAVKGEHYPGCVPTAQSNVSGRLYLDVSAADCARLDGFEGAHYARAECLVEVEKSLHCIPAWIYSYLLPHELSSAQWDPQRFENDRMAAFMATYTPTRRD
jgi:gamma-glutamylcyclotransferase (GGCT)/AIG2-like uncharacterized protein YtfP